MVIRISVSCSSRRSRVMVRAVKSGAEFWSLEWPALGVCVAMRVYAGCFNLFPPLLVSELGWCITA